MWRYSKWSKEWAAFKCSKFRNSCRRYCTGSQRTSNDLQLMDDHFNYVSGQIHCEDWKRSCAQSLFHTVLWMSKMIIESQLIKNLSRPVRSAHVFSVTSLMEMSLEKWERCKKCVAVKGYYVKENKTVFFYFPCVPVLVDLVPELYISILYLCPCWTSKPYSPFIQPRS